MNILVLGGLNSIVGHLIANDLTNKGFPVSVTGRERRNQFYLDPRIKIFVGELSDDRFLETIIKKQDVIINSIAAYKANLNDSEIRISNFELIKNIIKKIKTLKIFINLSTISVYGEVENNVLTWESPRNYKSKYGQYKNELEMYLRNENQISTIQLQLPAVLSEPSNSHLVNRIATDLHNNQNINIYNPKSLFNNVVSIKDLSEFVQDIIRNDKKFNHAFPIASEAPKEFEYFVEKMRKILNSNSNIAIDHEKKVSFRIDDIYAREYFGYKSKDTEKCIGEFISKNFLSKEK